MQASRRFARAPSPDPRGHHPDPERLALHAAGQLRPVERVVIEAHLASCSGCSDLLRDLLEPGARWLRGLERAAPAARTWAQLEQGLGEQAPSVELLQRPGALRVEGGGTGSVPSLPVLLAGLPAAAWAELEAPQPALRWRPVPLSRARYAVLAEDAAAEAELVLIELRGGSRFPRHLHLGHEEVVILAGGYDDAYGHFVAGSYHRYAPGSEHSALTDPGETCVAVGLIERGLRFRGLLGVLQWLFDPRIRGVSIRQGDASESRPTRDAAGS